MDELRHKVALSCRILALSGLVKETTGHVSARIPGSPHMYIRGRGEDESALLFTTEKDVLETDLDGAIIGESAHVGIPHELPIHGELYKARPEVGCVVHAHPPAVLLCGLTGLDLRPIFGAYDPSAMKLALGGVPVYPRALTLTRPELAQEMIRAMEGKDVCILRGHGITVTGSTVEEATVRAIKLESLARVTWQVAQRGPVPDIDPEDVRELVSGPRPPGSHRGSAEPIWRYYVQLLDHVGILRETL